MSFLAWKIFQIVKSLIGYVVAKIYPIANCPGVCRLISDLATNHECVQVHTVRVRVLWLIASLPDFETQSPIVVCFVWLATASRPSQSTPSSPSWLNHLPTYLRLLWLRFVFTPSTNPTSPSLVRAVSSPPASSLVTLNSFVLSTYSSSSLAPLCVPTPSLAGPRDFPCLAMLHDLSCCTTASNTRMEYE